MKPPTVPGLGTGESEKLEFKSAAVVREKDLSTIGREVAAFLNAKGGTLWIGIGEVEERASAYEPVDDAPSQKRRIHDYLIDAIEPRPASDELRVQVATAPNGADLVAVRATPNEERRPYALLAKNTRAYVARVGSRIRPMDREEIRAAFARSPASVRSPAVDELRKALEPQRIKSRPRMAMAIRPQESLELDLRVLDPLLTDPTQSDNRDLGFTVFTKRAAPTHKGDVIESGLPDSRSLRISRNGLIVFEARGTFLLERYEGTRIYPFAFIEIPTSFLRLARTVYRDASLEEDDEFDFAMVIEGVAEWTLAPYSPYSNVVIFDEDIKRAAQTDIAVPRQTLSWNELRKPDDRLALSVVRQLYASFGFTDRDVPAEFDATAGILRLPS